MLFPRVRKLKEFLVFVALLVVYFHPKNSLVADAFQLPRFGSGRIHSRFSPQQQCQIKGSLRSHVLTIDRHVSGSRLSERFSGEGDFEDVESKDIEEVQNVGGNSSKSWMEIRQIDDYGLIVGDVLAIILASQLMGLIDVLTDPEFARQGGWLQPIPAAPSTLGTLVERISTLSLLWLVAAIAEEESFTYTAIEDEKSSLLVALTITVNFVALRCILAFIAGFAGGSSFDGSIFENAQLGLALRDCYFVVLALPVFRFLYSKYLVRR